MNRDSYKVFKSSGQEISFLRILNNYFTISEIENVLSVELEEILNFSLNDMTTDEFCEFLLEFKDSKIVNLYFLENHSSIINEMLDTEYFNNSFDKILELFDAFSIRFNSYIERKDSQLIFWEAFEKVLSESLEQFVFSKMDSIESYENIDKIYDDAVKDNCKQYNMLNRTEELVIKLLGTFDWEHMIKYNHLKRWSLRI